MYIFPESLQRYPGHLSRAIGNDDPKFIPVKTVDPGIIESMALILAAVIAGSIPEHPVICQVIHILKASISRIITPILVI